ncbi:hypothetical protein [Streptomyces sp. NPDC055140]
MGGGWLRPDIHPLVPQGPPFGIASLGKPGNVLLVAQDGVPHKDADGLAA